MSMCSSRRPVRVHQRSEIRVNREFRPAPGAPAAGRGHQARALVYPGASVGPRVQNGIRIRPAPSPLRSEVPAPRKPEFTRACGLRAGPCRPPPRAFAASLTGAGWPTDPSTRRLPMPDCNHPHHLRCQFCDPKGRMNVAVDDNGDAHALRPDAPNPSRRGMLRGAVATRRRRDRERRLGGQQHGARRRRQAGLAQPLLRAGDRQDRALGLLQQEPEGPGRGGVGRLRDAGNADAPRR